MNGYSEFFEENGALIIHIEYYGTAVRHYFDYRVEKDEVNALCEKLGVKEIHGLIKYLTANYSVNNAILDLLKKYEITGAVENKGFEDASSDV